MSEDGIGRVLVASLHQSIAEHLPTRLGFYENWLSAAKLRDGAIGLAPLYAVLSFLRQEGLVYDTITARAGHYAAQWTVDSMPALRRSVIRRAPLWLRARLLMRVIKQVVRSSYQGSRAVATIRRGTATIDVRASVFCVVREPVDHPLCTYYASICTRLLALFDVETEVQVVACRGTGKRSCILTMTMTMAVSKAMVANSAKPT
jgi:bacteriochlorophyll 4-vinyl reductase